ncbi:MAG: YciI family protein [Ktedonobacterales bacterium]
MQYALLIYSSVEARAEAEANAAVHGEDDGVIEDWVEYTRAVKSAGALVALLQLQPTETATAVRLRGGERLLTDGPYIETKEHLLGFYLIEAPDLDTALDWAARMPHVRHGTTEVRPVQPTPRLDRIVSA